MANPDHVRFFLDGARVWNDWRAQNPEVIPDLSETDLTKLWRESPQRSGEPGGWGYDEVVARIRTATSDDARLFFGVDLHGADLRGAKCYTMCLVEANLSESNLTNADLTFTKLLGGNLSSATLHSSSTVGGVSWPQPVDSTQGDAFQREILVSRNIGKNLPYSL